MNFYMECRRFFGKAWIGAVILCLLPMVAESANIFPWAFSEKIDAIAPMINIFQKSALFPVSLFAVAIVCATSFIEDKANKFYIYQVFRCGRARYALTRFAATMIMSAGAVVFAQALFWAFSLICYPYPDIGYYRPDMEAALSSMIHHAPIQVYLFSFALQFIEYSAWAGLALAVSTVLTNQYGLDKAAQTLQTG